MGTAFILLGCAPSSYRIINSALSTEDYYQKQFLIHPMSNEVFVIDKSLQIGSNIGRTPQEALNNLRDMFINTLKNRLQESAPSLKIIPPNHEMAIKLNPNKYPKNYGSVNRVMGMEKSNYQFDIPKPEYLKINGLEPRLALILKRIVFYYGTKTNSGLLVMSNAGSKTIGKLKTPQMIANVYYIIWDYNARDAVCYGDINLIQKSSKNVAILTWQKQFEGISNWILKGSILE